MNEPPDTVHGRLLESVHLSGYTFERACGELEWLLDQNRWQRVGRGYKDINAFLATIDFSEFKVALEQRKKLAARLAKLGAGQRATGRLIGVSEATVARDLGKSRTASNVAAAPEQSSRTASNVAEAWFQADADPSREAKRLTANARREELRAEIGSVRPTRVLPVGCYRLLYADPPWQYEHIATESRAIENQYPTMTLDELCALEVPAADDAVLFLWATSPKLAEAMRVIDAWQFNYRTCAVWDKQTIGMGYYFRQQHELLLVAARGALPVPEPPVRPPSIVRDKRGAHSAKPEFVYELLESMYPHFAASDRLELFSRNDRPGWTHSSNEPAVAS